MRSMNERFKLRHYESLLQVPLSRTSKQSQLSLTQIESRELKRKEHNRLPDRPSRHLPEPRPKEHLQVPPNRTFRA
jgi:hypothetical protein